MAISFNYIDLGSYIDILSHPLRHNTAVQPEHSTLPFYQLGREIKPAMGAGYSRNCHSTPPTIYTLNRDGTIVPEGKGKRPFDNSPIVKAETLRPGGGFRNTFRKILARCSFSPGWIRYDHLLRSITGTSDHIMPYSTLSALSVC